ncbi:MAG: citrate synthase family protein [Myxococcota bacterium]|nr:citrate synthase family protein [Myxococcota bacterium]
MSELDQRRSNNQYKDSEYLGAKDAAAFLDVKLPTLYAYTSRGLVRSVPGPKGRARRYLRSDLERLRARRDARSGHGPVAAAALRFGEPVLDTHLTAIDAKRGPVYRGHLAVDLANAGASFERVSELLWTGTLPAEPVRWFASDLGVPSTAVQGLLPDNATPVEKLSVLVPLLAAHDPGRFATRTEAVLPRARVLMRRMAASLVKRFDTDSVHRVLEAPSMAAALATALGAPPGEPSIRALDRALVLCADHELNASAFAARIAASTGADVYACVSAALASLTGPRHGGAADRIEALLDEVEDPEHAEQVVHERARRGESTEGFGHALYPAGDPRGIDLLARAEELNSDSRRVRTCRALVEAMEPSGVGPTVELGIVALACALGLPRGSAAGWFAMARCTGWVAHSLEQYEAGYLLRPRARYTDHE